MEHVAIMKKSWGLTPKLLSGEKSIESRWYRSKYPPWDRIKAGDTVYFKDSGEPVSVSAMASRVLQFSDLTPDRVMEILKRYGEADGITKNEIKDYFELFKDKHYCILIFLTDVQKVKPFQIDKTGFGAMAAWITSNRLRKI